MRSIESIGASVYIACVHTCVQLPQWVPAHHRHIHRVRACMRLTTSMGSCACKYSVIVYIACVHACVRSQRLMHPHFCYPRIQAPGVRVIAAINAGATLAHALRRRVHRWAPVCSCEDLSTPFVSAMFSVVAGIGEKDPWL